MGKEILVSVICNAYNHENYIRDALESFLMQKTTFAFEVLVHDDASTDKTAEIIREYEKKHPDIIKPIYQTENQYSKQVPISLRYQFPRVKGKYIAFCEGDDYWIDPYKLQKQYEALELHPEVDICAHRAICFHEQTKESLREIAPAEENCILSVEKVIDGGKGYVYVATNSLMYRKELNDNIPNFRMFLRLDYTLQIHGSLRGGMLYLNDTMSAYRYMATGSWTSRMINDNDKRKLHYEKKQKMLKILDEETNFVYTQAIERRLKKNEFFELISEGNHQKLLQKQYKEVFNELSFGERLKIRIKACFPWLIKIKRKLVR